MAYAVNFCTGAVMLCAGYRCLLSPWLVLSLLLGVAACSETVGPDADEGTEAPVTTSESQKLTPSDGETGDLFGRSVAMSGDVAVVGAIGDDENGEDSGSAYVFERSDGTWSEVAKLTASDAKHGDAFGSSVAVSGHVALVGAPFDNDDGPISGSAYVFERSDGTWSEVAKLTASDASAEDQFGTSVAVSEGLAVVGAWGHEDNGSFSGAAYVFERAGGTWSEVTKLTASDGAVEDDFGMAVGLSGEVAVIGASDDDDNGSNSGSAYVFEQSGGAWSEVAKLTASDGAESDNFGSAVFVSSDVAVVGARFNTDEGLQTGSAYVYERSDATWSEVAKLTASDAQQGDRFGENVAVSSTLLVVGAMELGVESGASSTSGSAYVYERSGDSWTEVAKLTASDGAANDHFGSSVAVSGDVVMVGASEDDDNGSGSGSVYVFESP